MHFLYIYNCVSGEWLGWGKYRFGTTRRVNNSLAYLFVLGREIEITWPGVKESSSGGVARNWQLTLFSPRTFISTSGHLLFGLRLIKCEKNTLLSFVRADFRFSCFSKIVTCTFALEWLIMDISRKIAMRDFVIFNVWLFALWIMSEIFLISK